MKRTALMVALVPGLLAGCSGANHEAEPTSMVSDFSGSPSIESGASLAPSPSDIPTGTDLLDTEDLPGEYYTPTSGGDPWNDFRIIIGGLDPEVDTQTLSPGGMFKAGNLACMLAVVNGLDVDSSVDGELQILDDFLRNGGQLSDDPGGWSGDVPAQALLGTYDACASPIVDQLSTGDGIFIPGAVPDDFIQ